MDDTSQTLTAALQLHQRGKLAEAERQYREIVARQPANHAALYLLGRATLQQGRASEAVEWISRAVDIVPGEATYLTYLGVAYDTLNQWQQAAESFRRALAINPNLAEVHCDLGIVERNLGHLEAAMTSFERAVAINPKLANAQHNLGSAYNELGRFDAAERCHREAIRLQGQFFLACNSLGSTLEAVGRFDEALASYDEAIRLKPDYAAAHFNRATLRLRRGDFEAGWPELEWRWKCQNVAPFPGPQPRWDGSPLEGRTILIQSEHGLGDMLLLARYARLLAERGGRVVVQCQAPLVRLLARCPGVAGVVRLGDALPEFDVYVPLMSLPGVFGTTLATLPAPEAYLFAEPDLIEKWRRGLADVEGFRVGIVWQGNPQYLADRLRSIDLDQFAALASVPNVRLISLQKHAGTEQLGAVRDRFPIVDLGPNLDEAAGPFMDTAAVMKHLDLVIAPDTVTAHLAGALGVPVWIALSVACDWRWLIDRQDSPWYPSARLFRQKELGDWAELFRRMAAALAPLAAERRAARKG